MIKNRIIALFAVLVILMNPLDSLADSGFQGYFSALPDIPMMAGMDEIEDRTFVFDKAEGRVVETAGFLAESSPERATKFYGDVLAQLGWKSLKTAVFVRNNEQLFVNIEKVEEGVLVKFQLLPLSR